jgi:dimethylhistidine N-methyltransferase
MQHFAKDVLRVTDQGIVNGNFLSDVIEGLRQPQKEVFSKYFYDQRGSELFEQITELEEYYPTRTELSIMRTFQAEIDAAIGPRAFVVEYGSGSSTKTRFLLDRLEDPVGYVPIDISRDHLVESAQSIARGYPLLEVLPLVADYTESMKLPQPTRTPDRVVVYFPGSTIGNFDADRAADFLEHVSQVCGAGGGLLIGVDLVKDSEILEQAYDDSAGVTAAFNLNLLKRINRDLGADFDLEAFTHRAIWNESDQRIEMHLRSQRDQVVHIDGQRFLFKEGETIHTENSHKFTIEGFAKLAAPWFEQTHVWTDEREYFSLQYLAVKKE